MRWKFVLLHPDSTLPERFHGTAEEAARHALTIAIPGEAQILTASDQPLAESPDYPPGWFVRQVRKLPDRDCFRIEADEYDHGVLQQDPASLIGYFCGRLRQAQPCVFEVRDPTGQLLQVVIAERSNAQRYRVE